MEILFEDSSVLVCVKPVGVLSQADKNGNDSMIERLSSHTGGTVYPVHRLDRETGGAMVYAKTPSAAAVLSRQIAEHTFLKEYLAVLHGVPERQEDTLCDLLFKDSGKNKSYVVKRERKGVKKAKLDYKLLDTVTAGEERLTLVSVKLYTGRTHQIRVQFSHRKMPLIGDKKYGAKDDFKGLGLWSYKIGFKHPETGEGMLFTAKPQNIISEIFGIYELSIGV